MPGIGTTTIDKLPVAEQEPFGFERAKLKGATVLFVEVVIVRHSSSISLQFLSC